ncbi:MAG: hypothetical protein NTW84_05610 [Methanothrix sp.]|nr:hypothetical protein [Methanothrix sp.]
MGTQGIKTDAITQCYFTPQFLAWSVILHGLKKILKPLEAHLVIRAALGGLGLGLAGVSALFAMLIFQKEEGPVIAIATVFSFMATMSFSILPKTKKNADDNSQIAHQERL